MPHSFRDFDRLIQQRVSAAFPDVARTQILDVGAGAGKIRELLREYPNVDAVEIHEPYVEQYHLRQKYRNVYITDAREFAAWARYDLIVFGDMLEHLDKHHAKAFLRMLATHYNSSVLVIVPFLYEQGESYGNPHEAHLQPDLTPEVMAMRYPMLTEIARNERLGVYGMGKILEEATTDLTPIPTDASVFIATPSYGDLTPRFVGSIIETQRELTSLGISMAWLSVCNALLEKSRNALVAHFLSDPRWTHLLFVDSDQGWQPEHLLRLLALDRDFIGTAIHKKTLEPAWNVNFLATDDGRVPIENGAMEVESIGTGFLLIRREVFTRLIEAGVPKIEEHDPRLGKAADFFYRFFGADLIDGRYHGEDTSFCRLWRNAGGQVWCDPVPDLVHVGQYEYRGALASQLKED